ncbi:chlorophyllase-1-like isoform x2 [Plakobranchus ocellatus]|uniref:Chlorophyllase-1-like isoform x2 n=1 Tax=Plakobranchus ocellatus TaxID=259542 RepID=A0AAV3Z712_9GAST|nr:chlorophyllase-1-like isoform x2 [Plakobranchus ocellatus]
MMPWTDLVYAQEFPFTPGPYKHKQLRLTWSKNRCPLDSTVYYPSMSGDYTPIVFLGGFYDVISGEGYSDFLGKITPPWLHVNHSRSVVDTAFSTRVRAKPTCQTGNFKQILRPDRMAEKESGKYDDSNPRLGKIDSKLSLSQLRQYPVGYT